MHAMESKLELVSDLADGRLHGQEMARAVSYLGDDEAALRTWHAYHVVGDVLRSPDLALGHDSAFLKRLRVRLQDQQIEAPVLQPEPLLGAQAAANDSVFTWARFGAAMSVFVVAGAGWLAYEGRDKADAPALVQAAPSAQPGRAVALAGSGEAVMLRDPRLDQLIQAHRQAGGGSALQVPTGFLRNATYEVQLNNVPAR